MKLDQRHVSPDGELVLLVYHDPKDNDWIVGFEGSEWHTHGDVLAPTFGTTDEAAVDGFVNAVLEDRLVIGAIPIEGRDQLYITKTPEDDVAAQKSGLLRLRYWSGREYDGQQKLNMYKS